MHSVLWTILAFGSLCVVIPAYLTAISPQYVGADDLWLWPLAILLWAGVHLTGHFATGRPHLYSVIFWTFVYVFFGMAAMLQVRLNIDPNTTPNLVRDTFRAAFGVVLLGLAAWEIGALIAQFGRRPTEATTRRISENRAAVVAAFALLLAAVVMARVGPGVYFAGRSAVASAKDAAWGSSPGGTLVLAASVVFPLIAAHALFRLRTRARAEGRAPRYAVLAWLLIAVVLVTVNIFNSSRITFGTNLLSFAVLAGALATATRVRATMALLLAGLVLVFPFTDLLRGQQTGQQVAPTVTQLATSGDYDAFAQISNTVMYVRTEGVTWGDQALGVVFFWIPRAMWPGKAADTGTLLAQYRGYRFQNLSAPLWAEAYINFGLVGVVLVLGALGYFMRRADLRLGLSIRSGGLASVAGAVLPFYLIIVLRGSLLQATGTVVAIVIALWLISERRLEPRTNPPSGIPNSASPEGTKRS